MLGLNHNVRNVPVSNKTTKLHNAISPSMNDQWSGKTFRTCFFAAVARPRRSSAHVATPATRFFLGVSAATRPLVCTGEDVGACVIWAPHGSTARIPSGDPWVLLRQLVDIS